MFDFDPAKSAANMEKHGIDFEEAQALWEDDTLLTIPARSDQELRFIGIGRIDGRHWPAIFALRDANIRLISVRRARKDEVQLHENQSRQGHH